MGQHLLPGPPRVPAFGLNYHGSMSQDSAAAAAVNHLHATILRLVYVILVLVLLVGGWLVISHRNSQINDKAKAYAECVASGRTDCSD